MTPREEELKKQHIIDQITWDDSVNANNIQVKVKDGTVELYGSVQNYTAKVAAERDAYQVKGVQSVVNRLEIKFPPSSSFPDDQETAGNIENTLSWNSEVNSDNIKVESKQHVVTLSGTVNSFWEKKLAANLANSTHGVLEVVNELTVMPERAMLDNQIKDSIENAFKRTSLIPEDNIHVKVEDARVHMFGKVPNFFVKIHAYNIALYTTGVRDVVDDLTIW